MTGFGVGGGRVPMPNFFSVGFFKNDNVSSGSSVSFGQSVLMHRNSTKQNNGSLAVGDGLITQPIMAHLNQDSDVQDNLSADAQNLNNSPQV